MLAPPAPAVLPSSSVTPKTCPICLAWTENLRGASTSRASSGPFMREMSKTTSEAPSSSM
jgi:hypothetical protein